MAGKCIAMVCMALLVSFGVGAGEAAKELQRGFSVAHDASYAQFQPVLSDPTGVFAMGFLRINSTMLDLAVLHLPSAFALWRAIPDQYMAAAAAFALSHGCGWSPGGWSGDFDQIRCRRLILEYLIPV